jgi:hypothetical protein
LISDVGAFFGFLVPVVGSWWVAEVAFEQVVRDVLGVVSNVLTLSPCAVVLVVVLTGFTFIFVR